MKVQELPVRTLIRAGRLDPKYMLSAGRLARERLQAARAHGIETIQLGGLAKVTLPNRFKRAYAGRGEPGIPYLRPSDAFEYLPEAAGVLSRKRTDVRTYQLRHGTILQTRSGRNLGPGLMVDRYLERFCMSDDMIRIQIADSELRNYVFAFLNCDIGQQLLTRDKSGSVIDHIDAHSVSAQEIPLLDEGTRTPVGEEIAAAIRFREEARLSLERLRSRFEGDLPAGPVQEVDRSSGWTVTFEDLGERLDAASYDPEVRDVRNALKEIGGQAVEQVAVVLKPPGRYKTSYVEQGHGRPILSGRQLLQVRPLALRYIAAGALKDPNQYVLKSGWIAYQADGRAEDHLGRPVVITREREGWLASGHIARVIAQKGTDPGWLYLALASRHTQIQLKSLASGSVVDATFPSDMEGVILPPANAFDASQVLPAWEKFVMANEAEARAYAQIDDALARIAGG